MKYGTPQSPSRARQRHALCMPILLIRGPISSVERNHRWVERATQRTAIDAIAKASPIASYFGGWLKSSELVDQFVRKHVIRIQRQDPFRGDPGLFESEVPLA